MRKARADWPRGSPRALALTPAARLAAVPLALVLAASAGALPAPERTDRELAQLRERIRASQQAIRATHAELAPRIARHRAAQAQARHRIERAVTRREAAHALADYAESYAARLDDQLSGVVAVLSSLVRMQVDTRHLIRAGASAARREAAAAHTADTGNTEWSHFFEDQLQGLAAATRELAGRLEREEEGAAAGDVLYASWGSRSLISVADTVGRDQIVTLGRRLDQLVERTRTRFRQLRAERGGVRRLVARLGREIGVTGLAEARSPRTPSPQPASDVLPRCEPVSDVVFACRTSLVTQR